MFECEKQLAPHIQNRQLHSFYNLVLFAHLYNEQLSVLYVTIFTFNIHQNTIINIPITLPRAEIIMLCPQIAKWQRVLVHLQF